MERPEFDVIYMRLALDLSRRSSCQRLKVGTVITSYDYRKVLAVGYNGNAIGLPNRCDNPSEPGSCGCLHSEDNAVVNCDAARETAKIVYVTHLPCVMCAKRLINLGGVCYVFYLYDYRDRKSIEILKKACIPVVRMELPATAEYA